MLKKYFACFLFGFALINFNHVSGVYDDNEGKTLLHMALIRCYAYEKLKMLFDAGEHKNINVIDDEGKAPLHLALIMSCSIKIIKMLLDVGADKSLNVVDSEGRIPADYASGEIKAIIMRIMQFNRLREFFGESISDECPICCDNLNKNILITTCCRHAFCRDCLNQWRVRNNTCPCCRAYISADENDPQAPMDVELYE